MNLLVAPCPVFVVRKGELCNKRLLLGPQQALLDNFSAKEIKTKKHIFFIDALHNNLVLYKLNDFFCLSIKGVSAIVYDSIQLTFIKSNSNIVKTPNVAWNLSAQFSVLKFDTYVHNIMFCKLSSFFLIFYNHEALDGRMTQEYIWQISINQNVCSI